MEKQPIKGTNGKISKYRQNQKKKKKTTKGKIGKANYEDDNNWKEADHVLAKNRHGRWH
jgi:hypothetical protein